MGNFCEMGSGSAEPSPLSFHQSAASAASASWIRLNYQPITVWCDGQGLTRVRYRSTLFDSSADYRHSIGARPCCKDRIVLRPIDPVRQSARIEGHGIADGIVLERFHHDRA